MVPDERMQWTNETRHTVAAGFGCNNCSDDARGDAFVVVSFPNRRHGAILVLFRFAVALKFLRTSRRSVFGRNRADSHRDSENCSDEGPTVASVSSTTPVFALHALRPPLRSPEKNPVWRKMATRGELRTLTCLCSVLPSGVHHALAAESGACGCSEADVSGGSIWQFPAA